MNCRKPRRTITHFHKGIGIALNNLSLLEEKRGQLRRIRVFRHPKLGRVFTIGDEIQHVESWALLYHEPLVHLSASFLHEVESVLILGGGTLYAATEIFKYRSVKRVLLLDHDSQVLEMVARHYPHARRCLRDKRLIIAFQDAYSTLARMEEKFDLVINDGIDLLSSRSQSNTKLGTAALLHSMRQRLRPQGVCADVIYRHVFEQKRIARALSVLGDASVALSLLCLPEYHGVLHLLSLWGERSSRVTQDLDRTWNCEQREWARDPVRCPCRYFDPRFLRYFLYLPRYLREIVTGKAA